MTAELVLPSGLRERVHSTPQPARERSSGLVSWCLLLVVATSPLEWYSLRSGSGGTVKPVHLAMILLGVVVVTRRGIGRDVRRLLVGLGPLAYLLLAYVIGTTSIALWWGRPVGTLVRDTSYVFAGAIVGLPFTRFREDVRMQRILLWSSSVAVASFMGFAQISLRHTNILGTLLRALRRADPSVIQYDILGPLFRSAGLTTQPSLRHNVFIAILFACWLTLASLGQLGSLTRRLRIVVWLSLAAALALIVLSLSRAAIVALLLAGTGYALRPLMRGSLSRAGALGLAAAALATYGALATGAVRIVLTRFTSDTESYRERADVAAETLAHLRETALLGKRSVPLPPHNFVLNAFVAGGVMIALLALLILMWAMTRAVRSWWRWVNRGHSLDGIAFALLLIPIVRMFTAAAGLAIPEWSAVAIAGAWSWQSFGRPAHDLLRSSAGDRSL